MKRMAEKLRAILGPRGEEERVEVSGLALDAVEFHLEDEERVAEVEEWVAAERLGAELAEVAEARRTAATTRWRR